MCAVQTTNPLTNHFICSYSVVESDIRILHQPVKDKEMDSRWIYWSQKVHQHCLVPKQDKEKTMISKDKLDYNKCLDIICISDCLWNCNYSLYSMFLCSHNEQIIKRHPQPIHIQPSVAVAIPCCCFHVLHIPSVSNIFPVSFYDSLYFLCLVGLSTKTY